MSAFLFRLETKDGTPADPAELHAAIPTWRVGTRSTWASARCASWPCETRTAMRRLRSWSNQLLVSDCKRRESDVPKRFQGRRQWQTHTRSPSA